MTGLCDRVRESCARIVEHAQHVRIDLAAADAIEPAEPPTLDPEKHYLEGSRADVIAYVLTLDSINFGSGWFPTLNKRPGCSGYFTIAWALADHFRAHGPWSKEELERMDAASIASVLGQDSDHELMQLYAQAVNDLGRWWRPELPASAERLAEELTEMPFFADTGFWKRAQITANDLALAGVAEFSDLDRLTIFADNLVPHVLRVDGVLVYSDELATRIDSEELLPPGPEEREIRASAVIACEQIAADLGVPPRTLDVWLWNRGQGERYKSRPRHRTRTVYY